MYEIDLELYTIFIIQLNSTFEKLETDEYDLDANSLLKESIDNFREIYQSTLIDLSLTEINYGEYDSFFINVKSSFPRYIANIKEYIIILENEELKSNLNELLEILEDFIKISDIYFKKRGIK